MLECRKNFAKELSMDIDIKDLLEKAMGDLSGIRIIWPEERQLISLQNPNQLTSAIFNVLDVLQKTFPECDLCADYGVNGIKRPISFSFVIAPEPSYFFSDPDEEAVLRLREKYHLLKIATEAENGEFSNWNGLKIHISFYRAKKSPKPKRGFDVPYKGTSWDEIYQWKLQNRPLSMLRGEVYRFAQEVEYICDWAKSKNMKTVLCPAVGWSVDPWLYAHHGFKVIAYDISATAIDVVSQPEKALELYSTQAKEYWDIDYITSYYGAVNPYAFKQMPELENVSCRQKLQERIAFSVVDTMEINIEKDSVDIIFACNTLTRDNEKDHTRIMQKWLDILKPGGLIFVRAHNNYETCNKVRNFMLKKNMKEEKIYKFFENEEEKEECLPFWVDPKPNFFSKTKDKLAKFFLKKSTSPHNGFFQVVGSSG